MADPAKMLDPDAKEFHASNGSITWVLYASGSSALNQERSCNNVQDVVPPANPLNSAISGAAVTPPAGC
jgi:hypothetical protein